MNKAALTQSAFNRLLRTVLQFAASYLTVEVITEWIGKLDLDSDIKALLIGVGTALLAFLHRRFLDPSPVPSLVDDPTGIDPKHLADDGQGLT